MQNYKSILKDSFNLIVTNNVLWLFGLFAGIFASKNILLLLNEANYHIANIGPKWIEFNELITNFSQVKNTIFNSFDSNMNAIQLGILTSIFSFIILSLLVVFAIYSEIIIIDFLNNKFEKKTKTLKSCLKTGYKKLLKVFTLKVLFFIFFWFILKLVGMPVALYTTGVNSSSIMYLISLLATIIIFIVYILFAILNLLADINIITKNSNIKKALKAGYLNIIDNWLIYLELIIILFFIELIAALVFLGFYTLFFQPVILLIALLKALTYSPILIFIIYLFLAISVLILLFIYGQLFIFEYNLWISFYFNSENKKLESFISRLYKPSSK